jgi:Prokaryotic RING finger family 1
MGEPTNLCAQCGGGMTVLVASAESAPSATCLKCTREAPAPAGVSAAAPVALTGSCPYCLTGFRTEDVVGSCPGCGAVFHRECWEENGGCAVYGCSQGAAVEGRRAVEVPFSYWGQENKPCPACGQQILAAAKRCRHCGATFVSARPQDTNEFQSRTALEERLPTARSRVVTIFIFSVVPFLAPIGAVWALLWSRGHREELAALPPLYPALVKIGVVAAIVQTVALLVMTVVYFFVRGG